MAINKKVLALLFFYVCVTGLCLFVARSCTRPLAILQVDRNCQIVIEQDKWWEVGIPLYYKVRVNGVIRTPKSFLYSVAPEESTPRFELVKTAGTDIVGVVDVSKPHEILILYDRHSGESFPAMGPDEGFQEGWERGRVLLERFKSAIGDDAYTLWGAEDGRRANER
jgi:hypothetical protein